MKNKTLTLIMILAILTGSTTILLPASQTNVHGATPSTPLIKVEPPLVEAHILNEKIKVNVTINNLQQDLRVVAVQFRLTYNESLLKVVDVVEGPFMKNPSWNFHGTYFIWYNMPNNPHYGSHVIVGILLLPNDTGVWEAFPSGSGVLATITFQAIYIPVEPLPDAICPLNLIDTLILNDEVEEIPHELEHGLYKACSAPRPLIKVEPPLFQAQLLSKTFQVNVTINNLLESWRAIAVQFRLCYNETLLEVVDVTQGPFMQDPHWNLYGTYFIWIDQPNDPFYGSHVIVGILLLPNDTGVWEAFPSGSGVLATITFKTIYQERGLEKPPLICELTLVDTMVINDELEEIPLTLEHGLYKIYPTHIGDINYDGKVDMKDVAMVSKAFGSYPGYGPWNPICDVNGDKKVDIKDVAIVSKGFGWTNTYDP